MNQENRWKYAVTAAGFAGILGQILLLRQLEVLFGGNELTLGFFFACWLIGSGAGAGLSIRIKSERVFYPALAVQPVLLALSLMMMRLWPAVVGRPPGMIAGPWEMMIGSIILTSPYSFITGSLFTLGIKRSHESAGRIYLLEAAGAAFGGVISALMLGKINPFQFCFLILGINLIISFRRPVLQSIAACIGLIGFIWLSGLVQDAGIRHYWRSNQIILHEESKYNDITMIQNEQQYSVYLNGLLSASYPAPMLAEEIVHFPLLSHPFPKRILLVGGGFSGAVDEILKHPSVEHIDYIEIDGKLLKSAGEILPREITAWMTDPKVDIIAKDAGYWIKRCAGGYDVVILGVQEPLTARLNRYYTVEFFKEVKRILSKGGLFGFSLPASEVFIDDERAEILAGIRRTVAEVFPHNALIPGERCHFIAGRSVEIDAGIFVKILKSRGIQTDFISLYFLPARLSADRMKFLYESLNKAEAGWINRDFKPMAYLHELTVWERQFNAKAPGVYARIWKINPLIILIIFLILISVISMQKRGGLYEYGVRLAVSIGGCVQISLQIMLILAFQALYGFMYYQQALLITAFMAGAALGSWFACGRLSIDYIINRKKLLIIQALAVILPVLMLAVLQICRAFGEWGSVIMILGAVSCGVIGGIQYVYASGSVCGEKAVIGGALYAVDLMGAALGAVLTGLIIIPVMGIWNTGWALAGLSFIPLLLLYIGYKYSGMKHI
ncbi:MAG: hypothetical protein H8E87_07840 [FCB group bacterium]|nr:hypothetical protein [FCB group bacterium]